MRVCGGVGECLVADIYSIFSILGNVGIPRSYGWCSSFLGSGLPVCAVFKRVLGVAEIRQVVDESFEFAGAPVCCSGLLSVVGLRIYTSFVVGIVVDYYLVAVCIAFARQHHVGAGILHHRCDERKYVTHGIGVFDGLEQERTLPHPGSAARLVISAVRVPQGHDVVVHSLCGADHRVAFRDKSRIGAVLLRELVDFGDVICKRFVAHVQSYPESCEGVGERF